MDGSREYRQEKNAIGVFPDSRSVLTLVCTGLCYVSDQIGDITLPQHAVPVCAGKELAFRTGNYLLIYSLRTVVLNL